MLRFHSRNAAENSRKTGIKIMKNFALTLICAAALCLCFPKKSDAAYLTALDLLTMCDSGEKGRQENCASYIAGVIDYHRLIHSLGTAPTVDFCVPGKMKLEDVILHVTQYLKKQPQHDAFIASPAVALALFHYFPCKGGTRNASARRK